MKILHGMSDVAGQGSYSVLGLRQIGCDATIAVWRRNPFGYPVDIDLNMTRDFKKEPWVLPFYSVKMLFFAVKALFKYDYFHFHFGNSLLRYGLDLFWLKLAGKKFVMEYHGDDIRYTYNREKPKYYPYDKLPPLNTRRKRCNDRILKYTDIVITHDEELRRHIPAKKVYITPLRIDVTKFQPSYPNPDTERILLVHAPSNFVEKGSKYVLSAIKRLKKKYNFEFILVENKKQDEAIRIYEKADIIIDQMYAQTYGVFALEAMALGKPIVGYITDEFRKTFPKELPIVSASIDTLYDVLEHLILNHEQRKELGIAGRKYAEDYHDYRKVAQVQFDIYNQAIEPMSTLDSFLYTKQKGV